MLPAAADLPDQEETLLTDALGELPDHVTERPQRLRAHVLGGVDAETVQIGVGDPEAVDQGKAGQGRGSFTELTGLPYPDVEGFQIEHIPLGILRVVIPVCDVSFP